MYIFDTQDLRKPTEKALDVGQDVQTQQDAMDNVISEETAAVTETAQRSSGRPSRVSEGHIRKSAMISASAVIDEEPSDQPSSTDNSAEDSNEVTWSKDYHYRYDYHID